MMRQFSTLTIVQNCLFDCVCRPPEDTLVNLSLKGNLCIDGYMSSLGKCRSLLWVNVDSVPRKMTHAQDDRNIDGAYGDFVWYFAFGGSICLQKLGALNLIFS